MFLSYLPLIALPLGALLLMPASIPAWEAMWLLAINVFAGAKWLSWAGVRRSTAQNAGWKKHLAYFVAWPGLDAEAFLSNARLASSARPAAREWILAGLKTVAGALLFWGIARWFYPTLPLVVAWLGMTGLALVLHFGILHLFSCLWRTRGVNARRLMNNPLAATSVSDYWGKRWNTAFRDLAHRFIFRPVCARAGSRAALWGVFLFSGVVHDLVISVPAGGGYGLPTLFFLIQAAAIEIEHSTVGKKFGLGHGLRGWGFTMIVLAAPLGLLFHLPFLRNVVLPMMEAAGAI